MLAGAEGSGNVFMVGDEDQSIYGYRGAYPQALLSFPFDYPNARTLRMETNYRSGDEIVSAARTFIGGCRGRVDKRMVSGRGPGSVVRVEEVSHRLEQFDAALALIRDHRREGKGTLAVLYRNNETAIPLIDQLIREGVAFTLSGNANTLFTSPTVRDVKAFMRLALDPHDEKSFMQVYSKGGSAFIDPEDAKWALNLPQPYPFPGIPTRRKSRWRPFLRQFQSGCPPSRPRTRQSVPRVPLCPSPPRHPDDRPATHQMRGTTSRRASWSRGGWFPSRSSAKRRATKWTRGRSWRTAAPRFADSYTGA